MSSLLLKQIRDRKFRIIKLDKAMDSLENFYEFNVLDSKEAESAFKLLAGTVAVKRMRVNISITEQEKLLEEEINESQT